MSGGSTILEPFEVAPLGAKATQWIGGSTEEMTLVYRATRDGFDAKSFKRPGYNKGSPKMVSLIRASSGQGDDDSVVGGYSVVPLGSGVGGTVRITADTFIFMLKDGNATRESPSRPVKWNPYPNDVGKIFTITKKDDACVGGNDLETILHGTAGSYLRTSRGTCNIGEDSPFLALNGTKVIDMEVYHYSTPALHTIAPMPSIIKPGGDALSEAEAHDIDSFGRSIASSLMEERVVLGRAVKGMEAAGARVSAAVGAIETVYGPSVAAGEQDAVLELNVRGTRMTTLSSTLQACPPSALATMFDDERWPATDKDTDQHGRWLIDCNQTCFSKVLDVLRMRKRASWSRGTAGRGNEEDEETEEEETEEEEEEEEREKGGWEEEENSNGESGAVLIKHADVEAFGEVVDMYFPGCESFIMHLVQSV